MTANFPQDLLIVEDLMLLMLDDETGDLATDNNLHYVLGGALLVELVLLGRADLDEKQGLLKSRKVTAPGQGPLPDPLLQEAFDEIAGKPRPARATLEKIGQGLHRSVPARLVERGLVREERKRRFGIIPRTVHPAVDTAHEAGVRGKIRAVLADGVPGDPRTSALIALLSAGGKLKSSLKEMEPPLPWSPEVRKRAKAIEQGDWGAGAVGEALRAAAVAIAVSAAATSTTVVISSS